MQRSFAVFLLIFSSLTSSTGFATPPKAYIDMDTGLFSMETLTVNGKKFESRFWDVGTFRYSEAMKDNPVAMRLAEKQDSYGTGAGIALWGGLGGALAYLAFTPTSNFQPGVYWAVFGAGLITGSILLKISRAYLYKSVAAYNGVEEPQSSKLQFSIGPIASGANIGMDYIF